MPSVEWETPQDFFDTLDKEFHFDIDVCASEGNAKCYFYYTYHKNALYRNWKGVCWMNPPYTKEIGKWMYKAYESAQSGNTVICLIRGRSTDTKWWHEFVMKSTEIRFIKGRLRFSKNGTPYKNNTCPYPNIIIIFKPYCKGPPLVSSIDTKGKRLYGKADGKESGSEDQPHWSVIYDKEPK